MISVLLNWSRSVLWPSMVHLGIYCMGLWKDCIFCCYWLEHSIGLRVTLNFSISLQFSNWSINCWKRGIEVSDYNCGFVYLSLQFYQFLLHRFCSSAVLCVCIKTVVPSWQTKLSIIIQCSILSLVIFALFQLISSKSPDSLLSHFWSPIPTAKKKKGTF